MWLLAIPAAVVGLSLFKMGSAASKLLYTMAGYKVSKGNFIVKLQVTNPTNESFTINYIFLDLIAAGNVVGQIRQEDLKDTFIILPNLTSSFDVVIKPQVTSIITSLLQNIIAGKKPGDLLVKGFLKVNDIRIPYEQTVSYTTN